MEKPSHLASRDRGAYFFRPLIALVHQLKVHGKSVDRWTPDERSQMKKCYQDCFDELVKYVEMAEAEGKLVFVKEHVDFMVEPTAQTRFLFGQDRVKELPWTVQAVSTSGADVTHSSLNVTVLPDEVLRVWLPVFLVRHPGLAFPSLYRTILDNQGDRKSVV